MIDTVKRMLLSLIIASSLTTISTSAFAYDYSRWIEAFYNRYLDTTNKEEPAQTITDIVASSGSGFDKNARDYDILLAAVIEADLAGLLADNESDYTVFAPNDRAFIRLARDLGFDGYDEEGAFTAIVSALTSLGEGDPLPLLTSILSYHVADESIYFGELRQLDSVTTLLGKNIVPRYRQLFDAEPELKNPRILLRNANIKASNGVIHTISRVLIPIDLDNTPAESPTITDIVASSGGAFDHNFYDYDLLLNAVLAAGLDDDLAAPGSLTVFAPNDLAFVRLARSLGYRGHDEGEAFQFIVDSLTTLGDGDFLPLLTNVLLYHVAPEATPLSDIVGGEDIPTLLSDASIEPIGRKLGDADEGIRDPRLLLSRGDIRASNGLVHTINRVLLPVSVTEILGAH